MPKRISVYLALIALSIIAIGPFLWMLSTALKSGDENIFQYPPQFLPIHPTLDNFKAVWQAVPMGYYFINSFISTIISVAANLIFSILAAYPLARFDFKGKNFVFIIILATMMLPFQVIMIPLYLMVLKLGWVDNKGPFYAYLGLLIPFLVGGFGIFFVRQAMVTLPKQLEESAYLDGCSRFQTLVYIFIPLLRPTLATLAIFTFITMWGEFLWPSIVLTKPQLFTLPVGLVYLQSAFSANWRWIAAGSILATLPIIVIFLALQRFFIQGSLAGSIKG